MAAHVIRRKLSGGMQAPVAMQNDERVFLVALQRAYSERVNLVLDVDKQVLGQVGLGELTETIPQNALVCRIKGPGELMGLVVLSYPVFSGMIETMTLGTISNKAGVERRPSLTDFAIVEIAIAALLTDLGRQETPEGQPPWYAGFSEPKLIDDIRSLPLIFDDADYHLVNLQVTLAGQRKGQILMAFQAPDAAASLTTTPGNPTTGSPPKASLSDAMIDADVQAVECVLSVVVERLTVPISQVMQFSVGQVLELPMASLGNLSLDSVDGRRIATGKLGQFRGMRACRLNELPRQVMPTSSSVLQAPKAEEPQRAIPLPIAV